MSIETLYLLCGMLVSVIGIAMSAYGWRMHWLATKWEKRAIATREGCAEHRRKANSDVNNLLSDYRDLELLYNDLQKRHSNIVAELDSSKNALMTNAEEIVSLNCALDKARTQRANIATERDNLKDKVAELTDRIGVQFANLTEAENERDALKKELHIAREELEEAKMVAAKLRITVGDFMVGVTNSLAAIETPKCDPAKVIPANVDTTSRTVRVCSCDICRRITFNLK